MTEQISLGNCSADDCDPLTVSDRSFAAIDCATFAEHSFAYNELIMEHIFSYLKPSELLICGKVCRKWWECAQSIRSKLHFFSHQLLYYPLASDAVEAQQFKTINFMCESIDDIINKCRRFISRNRLNEFNILIVMSRLEYAIWRQLIEESAQLLTDYNVIHINTEHEIVGTLNGPEKRFECALSNTDINLFGGISALFMSHALPQVDINVYKDSQIYDIKRNQNIKCVLMFHIWRSFYGHFSRLKTDNDYFDHLESVIYGSHDIAFGGVTVNKLAFIANGDAARKASERVQHFCNNVCCVTFAGNNVFAYSFVANILDDNDHYLANVNSKLKSLSANVKMEIIVFLFGEHLKEATIKVRRQLSDAIIIGCSGTAHGFDCCADRDGDHHKGLFYKKGKCALLLVAVNKRFVIN